MKYALAFIGLILLVAPSCSLGEGKSSPTNPEGRPDRPPDLVAHVVPSTSSEDRLTLVTGLGDSIEFSSVAGTDSPSQILEIWFENTAEQSVYDEVIKYLQSSPHIESIEEPSR